MRQLVGTHRRPAQRFREIRVRVLAQPFRHRADVGRRGAVFSTPSAASAFHEAARVLYAA
jgi:hypothetical protein